MKKIISFKKVTEDTQMLAREIILGGLLDRFGFLDEALNPDLDDICNIYNQNGSIMVLGYVDNQPVGTGALLRVSEDTAQVVRMSVQNAHRGNGYGRDILNKLQQMAIEYRYDNILLETTKGWVEAINLYRTSGFTQYDEDAERVYMKKKIDRF